MAPTAGGDQRVVVGLGADGPDQVGGPLSGEAGAQRVGVSQHLGEPPQTDEALMGVPFLQFDKRVVGGGRSRQNAQQRADPRPHPGLGRGIGGQLSTRIGLVENPANPLALFDGRSARSAPPARAACTAAASSPALPLAERYTVSTATPAWAAIVGIVAPANPRSRNTRPAASMILVRVCTACSRRRDAS